MLTKRKLAPWTVVGVDNGSKMSALTSPGGVLADAWIATSRMTEHAPGRKCKQALDWIREVVEAARRAGHPVHVFIESPFISHQTMSAAIPLSRLQGALMAGAYDAGAEAVYEVAPGQWKLGLLGKGHGNAKKEEITAWMQVNWPWLFETALVSVKRAMFQDVIDAGGVMLYGADVLRRVAHLTEDTRQVLDHTLGTTSGTEEAPED